MDQQTENPNKSHQHFNVNKGIKMITISINSFVIPFSVMLIRIRSKHNFCQILFLISALITHLQLLMTCMYPMCVIYWRNDSRCFNLIQIFTVFTRLLPQNLSYIKAVRASYIICVISTLSFITLISLLLFYRPNSIFSSNSLPFLPTLAIFLLQILCYPMASLTTFFWFEHDHNYGLYPAIFCTVCFCFCFFGSKFYENVLHCLPNFPKLYGVRWSIPEFFVKKILCIFCFVMVETIPHLPAYWSKILCVSLITAVFAYLAFDNIYFSDGLLLESNVLSVFTFLSGTIFHFIAIFTLFASKRPGVYATLFIILSFPLYLLSLIICRARITHFSRLITRVLATSDFSEIDKLPVRLMLSCVGRNLPLITDNFAILDHIVEMHPNNFDVIAMYAKFAALTFCHFPKLSQLLTSLKKLCNLSFPQQVLLTFIEILSLQDESQEKEQKIGEMCSIALTEYLRYLNLFWTEILLGRSERLVSLSSSVDNKFQTAVCLFNLLHRKNEKMNSFEQFRSFTTLKIGESTYPNRYSFFNLLYQPKYQAIIFKGQAEALQQRELHYQPPLRVVHLSALVLGLQKKIYSLRGIIIAVPLVCAVIFAILSLILISLAYKKIIPSWDLFYNLEITGVDVSAITALSPYLLISNYDYINFTNLSRQELNNFLFNSKMLDVKSDMKIIIQRLAVLIPTLFSNIDNYNYKDLLSSLLNINIHAILLSFNQTVEKDMDFVQYLNLISIRYGEQLRMNDSELFRYFSNTNLSFLLVQNSDILIESINSFLMSFPFKAYDEIKKDISKLAFIIEMVMLATIVVFIIVAVLLIYSLFECYVHLFEPLFVIPKVVVSELIDLIASRPNSDHFSEGKDAYSQNNEVVYNLKQLAYERPSQTFKKRKDAKILYYVVIILFILVLRIIIIPVISISRKDFDEVFYGMKSAINGYSTQITLLKVIRDLGEFIYRHNLNITDPPERNEVIFNRILSNAQDLQRDLISLSFRGTRFPKIIDKGFFFRSPNNGSTRLANFSYVDKISYLYSELYQFLHYEQDDIVQQPFIQNILNVAFSAISQQIPSLENSIYSNAKKYLNWMLDKCLLIICLLFLIAFIFYLMIRFSPTFFIRNEDFAQPVFASIPSNACTIFKKYFSNEIKDRNNDEDSKLAMKIFDNDYTFQNTIQPLVILNSAGDVISMSNSACKLFNIETPPFGSFRNFLAEKTGENIDFRLPTNNEPESHFNLGLPNDEDIPFIFAKIINIKKFRYKRCISQDEENEEFSESYSAENEASFNIASYCVILMDITKLTMLNSQKAYELNHLRFLMAQLLPSPAIDYYLNDHPFETTIYSKLAIASFLIPTAASDHEIAHLVQEAVNDALNNVPSVTFFGRSIQMFRVISGLSSKATVTGESSKILLTFVQRLYNNIDQIQKHKKLNFFDIRCGIHLSGTYYGAMISELPLLFELFGPEMTVSQQIAFETKPKHVSISKDFYESIYDQEFKHVNVSLEKEIVTFDGEDMTIYNVDFHI